MKRIYFFNEGKAEDKDLLGGKGANLAEMTRLGFRVPQGFTITTKTCLEFFDNNSSLPNDFFEELDTSINRLEKESGKKFGDLENPLLVSVRSGAKFSMPGMMDTVLNLGLNDDTVRILAKKSGNSRFAYDSYRRFIQMFSDVVLGVSHDKFEEVLKSKKE